MDVSIVLPTYNESKNLPLLIPKIFEAFKTGKIDGQVVIVDDNSPDGTAKVAEKLAKKYKILIINRKGKLGLGTAYLAGFKKSFESKAKIIFSMDADLSHNPKYIPGFVKKINEGNDIVIGSRYIKGGRNNWGMMRKIISKGGNMITKFMLGLTINDSTSGYRAYRNKVLQEIDLSSIKSSGYSFLEEILYLAKEQKFKMAETPIFFNDRVQGESKLGKQEIYKFLITITRLKLRSIKKFFFRN